VTDGRTDGQDRNAAYHNGRTINVAKKYRNAKTHLDDKSRVKRV